MSLAFPCAPAGVRTSESGAGLPAPGVGPGGL